jgi:peroxiredoxin Q/BCP
VGISYDSVDALAKFTDKKKITFPLLSDTDSAVIKAYDVLNKEAKGKQAGIPHPATFLIDSNGVIRGKLMNEGFVKRHTTEELIKAAEAVK